MHASTIRAVRPVRGGLGALPDAVKAVADQYQFKGIPADKDIVAATSSATNPNLPATPLTFTQGKSTVRQRVIAIESLQIYAAGVLVVTRTNTKDSDTIADEILAWASTHFDIAFEDLRAGRGHSSQLDFRLERSLVELLPHLSRIGERIATPLEEFFEFRPPYELTALSFWFDKHKFPTFAPAAFRIDRRDGMPFEQNIYWSDAPLSTDDHIAVLTEFEQACLKALN